MPAKPYPKVPHLHLQGWGLHHFSGQPVPMLDNTFSEEIFPNIQSKPPLMQLEDIASRPIADYLGEETNTCFTTTSCQVVVESNKVPPQPPLLQTKQPQIPQLLLVRRVLLDPSPASLPFSGHTPAPQCLSCSEGLKTEHSTPAVDLTPFTTTLCTRSLSQFFIQ